MSVKIYVPMDSAAIAVGADAVAAAICAEAQARNLDITLVRNGSRGLFYLETLVEVATEAGRVAYGPVAATDVAGLFDAEMLTGGDHALFHGLTEDIPYFARQQRLIFARAGIGDPLDLDAFVATGGFKGLQAALAMTPQAIVEEVATSGLRGRGGAGFPAGIKWRTVAGAPAPQKYIVCNADEGDSGTFADRLIMEADPYTLIEGMIIAGLAVGATEGFIYLRSEYPVAQRVLLAALARARAGGWIGDNVAGSGTAFELSLFMGAGAYICGEETSLLESLEGKRGQIRAKPPLPAIEGLHGLPTVVNNVITLASVPWILEHGGPAYAEHGMGRSTGTLTVQLAGNIKRGGMVEIDFGATIRELVEDFGGGTLSGRPARAIQIGGPLGAYLPPSLWDTPLDYESLIQIGAGVGHGGIVVFDDTVDLMAQARFAFEFCAIESCGKCTPCRIGSVRGVEVMDRLKAEKATGDDGFNDTIDLINDLCEVMVDGSLCAMGGMTPIPVQTALAHFPEDFGVSAPRKPE